jgi:hypothetical protein
MPFEDPMSCQKSVPKTLCKNSPKNPQKPHKNLVGQKLLNIFKL